MEKISVVGISNAKPNIRGGGHPVETSRYILMTPSVEELHLSVCKWIDIRLTGAIVYGEPRTGKTSAIKYLKYRLPEDFPQIPIIEMQCKERKIPNENAFYDEFLYISGHALFGKGKIVEKQIRLAQFLQEIVKRSGHNRIVVFIDDAQRLHEIQFKWLMDIHNSLDSKGIDMVTILVGQPEIIHQKTAFRTTKKTQIIGRFMLNEFSFKGIRNKKEIAKCLNGYDEESEYPQGSGWSFTRYFFPSAFENGWRLRNLADDLWRAIEDIQNEYGLSKKHEIPMQYFCRAVEQILRYKGSSTEIEPHIPVVELREFFKNTGYSNAAREEQLAVSNK